MTKTNDKELFVAFSKRVCNPWCKYFLFLTICC